MKCDIGYSQGRVHPNASRATGDEDCFCDLVPVLAGNSILSRLVSLLYEICSLFDNH